MWIYYQTKEDGVQAWIPAEDKDEARLRAGPAYHISIYKLDKLIGDDTEQPKYKGDLWLDIDHKPDAERTLDQAMQQSISDLQAVLRVLEKLEVPMDQLHLFASGGKGFHIRIPGRVFLVAKAYKSLPTVHKYMAMELAELAEVEGIDFQLYAQGRGKLLRVENKPRANGKYKVPITLLEAQNLTLSQYYAYVSAPRTISEIAEDKDATSPSLAIMAAQCVNTVDALTKAVRTPVSSEVIKVLGDKHPTCVNWLVHALNIKKKLDKFNLAKMSLARYLNVATTDSTDIVDAFVETWQSDTNETPTKRRKALNMALASAKEYEFDCGYMTGMFSQTPCGGCPIKKQRQASGAQTSGIMMLTTGYYRNDDRSTRLTNFTLEPIACYVGQNENTFESHEFKYIHTPDNGEGTVHGTITLDNRAWQSSSEFKKQIGSHGGFSYTGNDIDLQNMKAVLTSPIAGQGLRMKTRVNKLGLYLHHEERHSDTIAVWVEPDYSLSATGATNVVEWKGRAAIENGIVATPYLSLKNQIGFDNRDEAVKETFWQLLHSNHPHIVGTVLGWVSACWLKPFVLTGAEKHFPALQLFGTSDAGKTETAKLYSFLAAADYVATPPTVISGSTPYSLTDEGESTASIPRIFDEFNQTKMHDKKKYAFARELVKSSASANAMKSGKVDHRKGGVVMDVKVITAPIIILGTTENPEDEIQNRTASVRMLSTKQQEHRVAFEYARANYLHLMPISRTLLDHVMANVSLEWVTTRNNRNKKLINTVSDRKLANWLYVLTGLDLIREALENRFIEGRFIQRIEELKAAVASHANNTYAVSDIDVVMTEAEKLLEEISDMSTVTDAAGRPLISEGTHYVVVDNVIHIFLTPVFIIYRGYAKQHQLTSEYSKAAQFLAALAERPYYLGVGQLTTVRSPRDWVALSLPRLRQSGVSVERFGYAPK